MNHDHENTPPVDPVASSVFNWRGTSTPASAATSEQPTPDQQPQEEERETMATTRKRSTRKSTTGSPQLRICSLLLQNEALTREAIAESLSDLTPQQISSALNNAKAKKRITTNSEGAFTLTAAGKKWTPASGEAEEKPTTRRGGHRKTRASKPRKEVDTSPTEEEAPTFRCGVMSDGAFFISKGETAIELDAEEHKQMLHYLERMAEPA